jgi:hypothetical protein
MNKEQEVFAKEISEMLTDMYNRGFADCEAAAKLAIEAGIKKAISAEREDCAMLCEEWYLSGDVAKAIRARGKE